MKPYARARFRKQPNGMNKLEAQYGQYLEGLKLAQEIKDYRYSALKLRLADNTFYTPDYLVISKENDVELHEVKGFWEDDARVKIKVAASLYPFRFLAARRRAVKDGGGWQFEEF
jgi:hypothetical protein